MSRFTTLAAAAAFAALLPFVRSACAEDAAPTGAPAAKQDAALQRARELDRRVEALLRQGNFAEASPLALEALALREKAAGKDPAGLAGSLNLMASILEAQGDYAAARPLYERAISTLEGALGKDHPDVAAVLNNLALLLQAQGDYAEARPLFERSLAIREKALGKDHPDVAQSLDNLAGLLHDQGVLGEARAHRERALAIYEKALGKDHLDVGISLANMARLLVEQGAHTEARPLLERSITIIERALGKDHPYVAGVLSTLAECCKTEGAFVVARSLLDRALAITEEALGGNHPEAAERFENLAGLLHEQGAYAEARTLQDRALAITEEALGGNHPAAAQRLHNLAVFLHAQGAYAEARPLYERALAIREEALGRDHPDVAGSINGLALLLQQQGALDEALPLLERALAICENARGKDDPVVATALDNLAVLLSDRGASAEALPLLERALAIREKAMGKDHLAVAVSLNNLALLLLDLRADAEATPLLRRALGIGERVLGPDHPRVALFLDNLACLFARRGAYAQARPLSERALAIREKAQGPDHADVARSLGDLAEVMRAQGDLAKAHPLYKRSLAIMERHVREGCPSLSPQQRLALIRSVRGYVDNWLFAAPALGQAGHAEALRMRGLVARAEAAERAMLRRADAGTARSALGLQAATRLAARLANEVPQSGDPAVVAAWQKRYAEAAAERERLAVDLSRRSAGMRAALERLDLTTADVQAALPADAALLDLLRVRDRYVGWVLHSTGEAVRVDLGAADAVEAACEAFTLAVTGETGAVASRGRLANPQPSARESSAVAGAEVRRLVWEPLEAKFGQGVRRVVVCPDAALASVPFGALPGRDAGRALLDDLSVSFVSHPFDLVPRKDAPRPGTGTLAVGGVDYASARPAEREAPAAERPLVLARLDRAPRGGSSFGPLPGTLAEAQALRGLWGSEATALLSGSEATEAALREAVKGRRVVHVATHGFAREDLLAGLYDRKGGDAFLSADLERQLAAGHDPMLLSGLALAGANPRDGGSGDDGILTALEASYLDLDGVELVTLSACETARGTAASGEGVLGLVSAFQMAGARHVVASLWKVDDEATRLLMGKFYEGVLREKDPLPPAQALREAALWLRDLDAVPASSGGSRGVRPDEAGATPPATPSGPAGSRRPFASPKYWAAFVAYGG